MTYFAPTLGRSYVGTTTGWQDVTPANSPYPQLYENIETGLRGELPEDVVQQIQRRAAEFGVAAGLPGSQFAGYGGLRQLGLTSLDRMQQAERLAMPLLQQGEEMAMRNAQLNWDRYRYQTELNNQARARALAANERARQEYIRSSGGGTPPIMGTGGAPEAPAAPPMTRSPRTSNTQAVLSDIISKYGGGGMETTPSRYTTEGMESAYAGRPSGENILMSGRTPNFLQRDWSEFESYPQYEPGPYSASASEPTGDFDEYAPIFAMGLSALR